MRAEILVSARMSDVAPHVFSRIKSSTAQSGVLSCDWFFASSEFVYLEQSINYFLIFILIFRMFAANFACLLIFAQTEENRLTQFPVAGPLSEFDLRDESRIYPVHFPHHRRRDALHPLASLF